MSDNPRKETITRTAEATFAHKKLFGGAGEFADVTIRLEPLPRGSGIEYANGLPRSSDLRHSWIAAVGEGIREAAKSGVLNGGAVVDFKASLFGRHISRSRFERANLLSCGARCILGCYAQGGSDFLLK